MAVRRAVELEIREYVLTQRPKGDIIRHAHQLSTAHFMSERFEVWDVQVRATGWWVVTNPIGMYSKRTYTSMHDAYWFHLGKRTWASEVAEIRPVPVEHDRLRKAWRLWEQAKDALEPGDETEDFQAVGMRCRQALLAFVKEVAQPAWVAPGHEIPKAADFLRWSEYIADHVAAGSHSERVRGYLKALAKSAWDLVNWLTHVDPATRVEGRLAVAATANTIASYALAVVRKESGAPDRCPSCDSLQLIQEYLIDGTNRYVTRCEACGWEATRESDR